jgi:enterobactin synthetase component D / holo-[acyl-carrier protein] synthase
VRPLSDSTVHCDQGLFFQLFPRPVGVAASRPSDKFLPLFPEEEQAVRNSVAKRRIEFAAGRYCARMAMAQLGYTPCGIPSGPDRAPVWPLGLVGSITHSTDFCAAVVARSDCFQTIGIDAEPIDAIPAELVEEILRSDEAGEFNSETRPDGADWPTLYFCLKEAAFKAFYPTYRRIIGFHDMRVRVDLDARRFLAELSGLSASGIPIFQGRYLVRDGRVHAACW